MAGLMAQAVFFIGSLFFFAAFFLSASFCPLEGGLGSTWFFPTEQAVPREEQTDQGSALPRKNRPNSDGNTPQRCG
jgi:hypothetical protein